MIEDKNIIWDDPARSDRNEPDQTVFLTEDWEANHIK